MSLPSSSSKLAIRTLVLCCALALFSGCSRTSSAAPVIPPQTVQVATGTQQDTPIYSEWVATLDGYVNAQIQPRVSGHIIKQNYKKGYEVQKGHGLLAI